MKNYTNDGAYKSRSTIHNFENRVQIVKPIDSKSMAKKLMSFSVTIDSVVATASIVVDESHKHLSIHWGDDQIEVVNLRKLRLISPRAGSNQEPNTLVIQHVYQEPFDHGRRIIIAETTDIENRKSFDSAVVDVDRRYKLSFYSIVLSFPEHLDSRFETDSEVEARMYASQESTIFFSNSWKDNVTTAPQIRTPGEPITWRLDESSFTREIKYSDEPIYINLALYEHDGLGEDGNFLWEMISYPARIIQTLFPLPPVEFDTSAVPNPTAIPLEIHPRTPVNSSFKTATFNLYPEGKIYAIFYYDLDLVIPLDRSLDKVMAIS